MRDTGKNGKVMVPTLKGFRADQRMDQLATPEWLYLWWTMTRDPKYEVENPVGRPGAKKHLGSVESGLEPVVLMRSKK